MRAFRRFKVSALALLMFAAEARGAEPADSTTMDRIPIGSEVHAVRQIQVKVRGGDPRLHLFFADGKLSNNGVGSTDATAAGVPGNAGQASEITKLGFCSLFDEVAEYGDGAEFAVPPGSMFTIRNREELKEPYAMGHRGHWFYTNRANGDVKSAPKLQCRTMNGEIPTYGQIKQITSGLIRIELPAD